MKRVLKVTQKCCTAFVDFIARSSLNILSHTYKELQVVLVHLSELLLDHSSCPSLALYQTENLPLWWLSFAFTIITSFVDIRKLRLSSGRQAYQGKSGNFRLVHKKA